MVASISFHLLILTSFLLLLLSSALTYSIPLQKKSYESAVHNHGIHHKEQLEASIPMLWPLPQSYTDGTTRRNLAYPFSITDSPSFPDMDTAIQRYLQLIFPRVANGDSGVGALPGLVVNVMSVNVPFQMGVDESYEITISDSPTSGPATITANTFYGALNALETFSQLVRFDFNNSLYYLDNLPVTIKDFPRFPHRGVLVDTSRHFEPVQTLLNVIDTLHMAKFNVFHWHLSDIQSFPYHSPSLPRFSLGAYSLDDRYSIDDLTYVVEYARQRNVRTMIEFDVPGHMQSWCVGYPDVCPSPTCQMPIDPSTNATFDLMSTLFGELTGGVYRQGVFYEDLFHLGGDEVDMSCWTSVPHVASWLKSKNWTTADAYYYVVEQAHAIVEKAGRSPVNWDEVYANFGTKLDKSTIIHVWRSASYLPKVVADGFRGILSPDGPWYLDGLSTTWQQMYAIEPFTNITSPDQQALVLGGEACMWGETVDTSDIMSTIWPRAGAISERLWSDKSVVNTTSAESRLAWFRCLLNRRGIGAAPLQNAQARSPPPEPGACLSQ